MIKPNFRVLVDWDNDGFVNRGVPIGTSPNLLKHAAYRGGLDGWRERTQILPTTITITDEMGVSPNIDNQGLLKLSYIKDTSYYSTISYIGVDRVAAREEDFNQSSHFSMIAEPSTTYTITYWKRAITGTTTESIVAFRLAYLFDTTIALSSSTVTTYPADAEGWVRTDVVLTTPATYQVGLVLKVETALDANPAETQYTGFMYHAGDTKVTFNTGSTAEYDDISSYVLQANWKLGRSDYDDPIAYEGTAEITLNNSSRLFSPENQSSPLFGLLRQNVMVLLEVETSINNWVRVWSGWVEGFEITAGTNSNQQAIISCNQGLYRLRDGSLDYVLEEDITATEAIIRILETVGFRSTYAPLITTVGFQAYVGVTTYLQDVGDLFSEKGLSTRTSSLYGKEWGRKTTPEDAIKGILLADIAKMWINRDGSIALRLREADVNAVPAYTLNLGTDVQAAEYEYGKKIINRIETYVKEDKTSTSGVIWATKEAIAIPAHVFGDGNQNKVTRYRELQFEFEEGKQRVITQIDGGDISEMSVTVYNADPSRFKDPTPFIVPSGEWAGEVHATVLGSDSLRKRLQVRNNLEYPVWVDIEISGEYVEGGDATVYVNEDTGAQELISATLIHSIELTEATTEAEAKAYAEFLLHRYAYPVGEFRSITQSGSNLLMTLGDVIDITEAQTGVINRRHVVIEESGNYSSGSGLEVEYTLARIDEQTYYAVGDTLSNSMDNLVPNLLDDLVPLSGTFDKVSFISEEGDTAYKFYAGLGNAGILVLGNLEGQFVNQWENSYDVTGDVHTFEDADTKGFATGIRTILAPEELAYAEFILQRTYDRSLASSDLYIKDGQYYISYGFKSDDTSLVNFRIVREDTGVSLILGTTDNNPSHATVITPSFSVTPDTYKFLARSFTPSGSGSHVGVWGELNVIHLPTFPTDRISLLPSTTYYMTFWAYSTRTNALRLRIIAEGGIPIHDANFTLNSGFNKVTRTFTTGASNNKKHGIIIDYASSWSLEQEVYFYGIALTEETPDTYTETNETQSSLPLIYI